MWHQNFLGHWWINACSCCILSRTLGTGRKGYTSLIIGPLPSLAEKQKVQLFLMMPEPNWLLEKTALRAVGSPLAHILRGEGSAVHSGIYGVCWWSLVISKPSSEIINPNHRESYFECWWSGRERRTMSKSKCVQIQTTGCVTDTQKKWIKLVIWSEVDIGNKHLDNTFYLDQTSDSKRKLLLFILALNHHIYFLFKIHQSWPNWLPIFTKYIPHTTEAQRKLLESLKNSEASKKRLWINAIDETFDKCISARERCITSQEKRCFKKNLFSGTRCLKDYQDSFVL